VSPEFAEEWAKAKFEEDVLKEEFGILEGVKSIIAAEGTVPDVETVREIDRRLRICKNPEKVVGTKAYVQHLASGS
jgi:cyclin H